MNFSTIVRESRISSGHSQSDLAARAGVSLNAIWKLENQGDGTVALLTKVIAALDVRFTELPRGKFFADQIKIMRTRWGWSQERLAEKAGVSTPAVHRLERGNTRIETLAAVLKVLAPGARVRKPEVTHWGVGARDERFTPPDLLEKIERVVGPITFDPCAHPQSKVRAKQYYSLRTMVCAALGSQNRLYQPAILIGCGIYQESSLGVESGRLRNRARSSSGPDAPSLGSRVSGRDC